MESNPREDRVGLCARCVHARTVEALRATYWLCGLAKTDPRFVKYPRLPVLVCSGHVPRKGGGDPP